MTDDEIRTIILEEINGIAPDADFDLLEDNEDIRDALDMDSMDVLNLVIAIHNRLHIDIPEEDATKLVTVGGAVSYISVKIREKR